MLHWRAGAGRRARSAGRAVPAWDRAWQGWIGSAELVEQKEMPPEEISLLVRRYYAYIRGGQPDPAQVEMYRKTYPIYRRLYPALKPIFDTIHQ